MLLLNISHIFSWFLQIHIFFSLKRKRQHPFWYTHLISERPVKRSSVDLVMHISSNVLNRPLRFCCFFMEGKTAVQTEEVTLVGGPSAGWGGAPGQRSWNWAQHGLWEFCHERRDAGHAAVRWALQGPPPTWSQSFLPSWRDRAIMIPISQMRKLRPRQVKWLAQGHAS